MLATDGGGEAEAAAGPEAEEGGGATENEQEYL